VPYSALSAEFAAVSKRMLIWLVALGFSAVFLAHTAPFPFLLEAFKPARSVWHVRQGAGSPAVYLTFDDGPNPTATPALLDVLARENVRATFFLIDAHLTDETSSIVRRMFAEGHAVALHADTRRLMLQSPEALAETLTRYAARIEQLAGGKPCRLFRPHAGWRSGHMYAGLERIDYRLAGWSWGLWDWNWFRAREADALAARLAKRASAGDIIVMHDGHHVDPRPDRRYAVEATAKLIPALRAKGYQLKALCN
jgi:peptidoglycan/xylan/chitin deacetylase (PgdA/CDA1 family)